MAAVVGSAAALAIITSHTQTQPTQVGNQVDVVHAWKIPGDVDKFNLQEDRTWQKVNDDASDDDVEGKVTYRFEAGHKKEKLFMGHQGWSPDEWSLTVGTMSFVRAVCAEKAGMPGLPDSQTVAY